MKLALVAVAVVALAACSPSSSTLTTQPSRTTPATSQPQVTFTTTPVASPTPTIRTPDTRGATPAPAWLGTRILKTGPDGFGVTRKTPKELRVRDIITKDLLPPPTDGRFHSKIQTVPVDVLERSTWSAQCPVAESDLRYVTVSFRGFDGLPHTGELLVNRSAATAMVTVFRKLFQSDWPIEEMRITSQQDLDAPPTGDGNDTSAFACRATRGSTVWSQHAYGRAVDLNPFINPYVNGRTILPELAGSYTDRARREPGMNTPNSVAVKAFRSVGWGWGGDYRAKKDWMHFSANGQ